MTHLGTLQALGMEIRSSSRKGKKESKRKMRA